MPAKIRLTKRQKRELKNLKRISKSEIIRDRAHAVLLRSQGYTIENTAQALMRSKEFINQATKRFQKGELQEIKLTSNNRQLTTPQKAETIKTIQEKNPNELSDFKFKEQFWTTDILKSVLKKKYNIEYKTEKSYYDLFEAAGFSFHKPKTRDFRQDPAKMKEFKGALRRFKKGALKKSSTTTRIRLSW